jgi:ArsR family transcriptional regulator, cadmium/lead-responsive transcriptional repressor
VSRRRRGDVEAVFAALSSSTRREILEDLATQGPQTASQLQARHPVSRQAISKHLGALAGAGLVESTRDGREVRYRVTPEPLAGAVSWIADIGAEWDRRLERLRRSLDG